MANSEANQPKRRTGEPVPSKQQADRLSQNPVDALVATIQSVDTYCSLQRDEDYFQWLDLQRLSRTCGYVISKPGSGLLKSSTLYCRQKTKQRGGLFVVPARAIYVEIYQPGTPRDFYGALLDVFGHPLRNVQDSLRSMRKRTWKMLRDYRVETLVIGNADFLHRDSLPEFENIFSELKINLILVGTNGVEKGLSSENCASNCHKRLSLDDELGLKNCLLGRYQFPPLLEPSETNDDVSTVIDHWEKKFLPEEHRLNLVDNDGCVSYLYQKSNGLIEILYNLLRRIAIARLLEPQYKDANLDAQMLATMLGAKDSKEGGYRLRSTIDVNS